MGLVVCTTALNNASYRAEVGQVYEDSNIMVVRYPTFFTDPTDVQMTGPVKIGTALDAVAVKGTYLTGTIVVSVPAIAGNAVLPSGSAVVDISADPLTFAAAVGDAVTAIPQEALESDCLLVGAYVVGADSIEVVFAAKEGGDGVTNANKNFKFLITDLT